MICFDMAVLDAGLGSAVNVEHCKMHYYTSVNLLLQICVATPVSSKFCYRYSALGITACINPTLALPPADFKLTLAYQL